MSKHLPAPGAKAALSLLSLLLTACPGEPQAELSFAYSLWHDNGAGALVDFGCINAGIERLHVDLFSQGVNVGSGESICVAFGNGDARSLPEELGLFSSLFSPLRFDELRLSLIGQGGVLVPFGMRLDGVDQAVAEQQVIRLSEPVSITAGEQVLLDMPGEPGTQAARELQLILPP